MQTITQNHFLVYNLIDTFASQILIEQNALFC